MIAGLAISGHHQNSIQALRSIGAVGRLPTLSRSVFGAEIHFERTFVECSRLVHAGTAPYAVHLRFCAQPDSAIINNAV